MSGKDWREQFLRDRAEALLSLDLEKVRAFSRKYDGPVELDDRVLEIAVHKARCNALDLPLTARTESANWLAERGYSVTLTSTGGPDAKT